MKKKFTSIILSLFMIFSVFVGNVSNVNAVTFRKDGIYVNGQQMQPGDSFKTINPNNNKEGTVTYKLSGELILENAYLDTACSMYVEDTLDDKAVIFAYNATGTVITQITFKGDNYIKGQDSYMSSYGVYIYGDGKFVGEENATLTVDAGKAGVNNTSSNNVGAISAGIHARQIILEQGIFSVSGNEATGKSYGLYIVESADVLTIGKKVILDATAKNDPIHVLTGTTVTVNTDCNKNITDSDNDKKVHIGHKLTKHDAVDATCTDDGNHKYYVCETCTNSKKYKDSTGISVYTETGNDKSTIQATGHDDPMEHKAYKAATCTEDGNVEYYYCSKCEKYFTDAEATEEIDEDDILLTKTGHSMQHIAKVPATCTEDGCEEYYYCSKCDKYFGDEEGQNVVTLSELKIDATGHDFDDGIVSIKDNVKTTTYTCKNCQTTKMITEDIKEIISADDKNDETKVDKKEEAKVNTGDNSNLVLWFGLLALSIISLFVVRKRRF